MEKTKTWCDIILVIGVLLIVFGLIVPHTFISGTYEQGLHASIKRTAIAWSFGFTGFSFVLLSSVFKLFLKNIETDLKEIKFRLSKMEINFKTK